MYSLDNFAEELSGVDLGKDLQMLGILEHACTIKRSTTDQYNLITSINFILNYLNGETTSIVIF